MANVDKKLMFGGVFAQKAVREVLNAELRATVTAEAVAQLPDVSFFAAKLPPRTTTGLVDWYRRLGAPKIA